MKYLALIWTAAMCGVIYMFMHMPTRVTPTPPNGVDEKLWHRGMVMYRARCISCHNSNPDLPGSVGPKLRGVSEELLRDRLTNGKGGMPAQKNMLRFVPAFIEFLK